jgi:hypothetical protein
MPHPGQERGDSLAPDARQQLRLEQAREDCPQPLGRTDEHKGPLRGQDTPAIGERTVRTDIEQDVVALVTLGE